jgi:hypothetical protein
MGQVGSGGAGSRACALQDAEQELAPLLLGGLAVKETTWLEKRDRRQGGQKA